MLSDIAWIDTVLKGALAPVLAMAWVILLVRVFGLRSFSKMTNFDFVMTVAMGSLLASAGMTNTWADLAQIHVAMLALFVTQAAVAVFRRASDGFEALIQNQPVLLMRDGEIFPEVLKLHRIARDDLIAKLREANVLRSEDVRAVILETTGDISVLHGDKLDEGLLEGVAVTT